MFGYWLMLAPSALATLLPIHGSDGLRRLAWLFFGVVFTLMIGFRYRVGGIGKIILNTTYRHCVTGSRLRRW